jgi:hypothetical protein
MYPKKDDNLLTTLTWTENISEGTDSSALRLHVL